MFPCHDIIMCIHYCPFVRGIHQWLVDSPHKWPEMQKVLPCHNNISLWNLTPTYIPAWHWCRQQPIWPALSPIVFTPLYHIAILIEAINWPFGVIVTHCYLVPVGNTCWQLIFRWLPLLDELPLLNSLWPGAIWDHWYVQHLAWVTVKPLI